MTDTITGTIDNGNVGQATIGGYTGPAGISRQEGSRLASIAFRGKLGVRQQPATGTLNGAPFAVLSIKRSEIDPQMTIAAIELAE